MSRWSPHAGDDGLVHYCAESDPDMRWLCGRGRGGSAQREDLDMPLCSACNELGGM